MESCEETLRALARQGLALNEAHRSARDAVSTEEQIRARAAYNLLHVETDATCRALLKTLDAASKPEPQVAPETALVSAPMTAPDTELETAPVAAPTSLFELDEAPGKSHLGAFR